MSYKIKKKSLVMAFILFIQNSMKQKPALCKSYLKESVSNFISIIGEIRSYRMLYTASSMGILT